jgi:two-component system, OmpR family, phosphate regulon sensor histidine kinase PhoR
MRMVFAFGIIVGLAVAGLAPAPAAQIGAFLAGLCAAMLFVVRRPWGENPSPAPVRDEPAESSPPGVAELLAAFADPILIVRSGRVLLSNAAAKALLGDHIEGADVRLAIRDPAAADLLAETSGSPPEPSAGVELIGLGEVGRRWELSVAALADDSRLVRLSDRSESHAAEQARSDFVANASHELRTPLATLLGFLETLQDEEAAGDPKTRTRFLKVMFDEANRMRDLTADLMSLSRIEAERYAAPSDSVDLLPLIDEVRLSLATLLDEQGSELLVENEAADAGVIGDRPQLAQLLNNLLVNAVRYGRSGAPIRVRIEDDGAMILLSVIDEGEGIAPEHIPRLTERFYRVDAGRSRSVGGTGLGLAIVKHIVGRHRGRLEIRSRLGEGTVVGVYLPRSGVVT